MLLKKIIYVFLLISLGSCSLFKKLPDEAEESVNLRNAVKLHLNETKKNNHFLIENASFTVEADKKFSAKITLYAEKQELIFGSIRFLGFELVRFKLTRDSLFYINRLNKEYLFADIKTIQQSTGFSLDYKQLENIIFTGFLDIPNTRNHEFFRQAKIKNDSIQFPYQLYPNHKVESTYSFPDLKLVKLYYSDIPGMVRTDIDIRRTGKNISSIEGIIQKELFLAKFDLEINEITNKKYSKTKFNIGRNYKEISNIF